MQPCQRICEHLGAAFSLILEEKTSLGLAAPPPEHRSPIESLDEDELIERALAERAERARTEKMKVKSIDAGRPWTDYIVTNHLSGKTYRVALRGLEPGDSYCSCPDFRTNTLGTCKHVLRVIAKGGGNSPPAQLRRPTAPTVLALHLRYGRRSHITALRPEQLDERLARIVAPLTDRAIDDLTTWSSGWGNCRSSDAKSSFILMPRSSFNSGWHSSECGQ